MMGRETRQYRERPTVRREDRAGSRTGKPFVLANLGRRLLYTGRSRPLAAGQATVNGREEPRSLPIVRGLEVFFFFPLGLKGVQVPGAVVMSFLRSTLKFPQIPPKSRARAAPLLAWSESCGGGVAPAYPAAQPHTASPQHLTLSDTPFLQPGTLLTLLERPATGHTARRPIYLETDT